MTKKQINETKKAFEEDEGIKGLLQMVLTRFDKMRGIRSYFEQERITCDAQFNAELTEDTTRGLIINVNLEQNLIGADLGRVSNQFVFDVKPAWYNTDVNQLEQGKYVLQSFLDKEMWYDEFRRWKQDKARYGTAIWFTGLRLEVDHIPQYAPKAEPEDTTGDGFFTSDWTDKRHENWLFTPQNIPIRAFCIDDKHIYQNDFNQVEDCVMIETLSKGQFVNKYGDLPFVDQDCMDCVPIGEESPKYGIPSPKGMMVLFHYFNKSTKDYIVVVNRSRLLFKKPQKMMYRHGKLPFDVCQHYSDSACMYGISIPRKVRVWKGLENNLLQFVMDGSKLNAGKMLVMADWSGENVDGDYSMVSGGVSLMRLTNSVDSLKTVDTTVDVKSSTDAIQMVKNEIKEATGIDLGSPFDTQDETLGQTEIRETNKALRYNEVDELMFQSIGRVFSMTLSNIGQFAPVVLKRIETVTDKEGNTIDQVVQRPMIQINNVRLEKKKGTTTILEDYGNYGYLELKPDTLEGDMLVNIVTPFTGNQLGMLLEKNRFTELTTQVLPALVNLYGQQAIQQVAPFDQLWDKAQMVYNIDSSNRFTADTKKTRKIQAVKKKITDLQQHIQTVQQSLQGNPQQPNAQQATPWQWATQVWAWSPGWATPPATPAPSLGTSPSTVGKPAAPGGAPQSPAQQFAARAI